MVPSRDCRTQTGESRGGRRQSNASLAHTLLRFRFLHPSSPSIRHNCAHASQFLCTCSLLVGQGALDGLNNDEKLSYATLWHIICGPISTGNDLTVLDSYGRWLLGGNADVLAINAAGVTAVPSASTVNNSDTDVQVWITDYNGNGTYVIAMFNLSPNTTVVSVPESDWIGAFDRWMSNSNSNADNNRIGASTPFLASSSSASSSSTEVAAATLSLGASSYSATDVWYGFDLGTVSNGVLTSRPLPPHGVQLVRLEVQQ